MKITKNFIGIAYVIFLIGFVFFILLTNKQTIMPLVTATIIAEKMLTPPIEEDAEQKTSEDGDKWENDYDANFSIKLLETGEFHGDEIKAQSGETWIGLFRQGNEFSLVPTKIKVQTVFDVIADEEEKGEKTGKGVSIIGKNQPVFLLKDAAILKQEKIKTVFYEDTEKSFKNINITNKTDKTLKLNSITYNLFVSTEKEKGDLIDQTSKLILSDGKTKQVIYSQKRCDDCGWGIYWAGDLDNDGKLDLYLNLSDHYNVNHRRLFLSSQSETGKLVKESASFRTVGC